MDIIRLHFIPSKAGTYVIKWRPVTDLNFLPSRVITYTVTTPGTPYLTVDLPIDNLDVDWYYEITGICAPGSVTPTRTGVLVSPACRAVTFTSSYEPDICNPITGIITQTS